ncbi:MAG: TRAP transporter large permease, partial [Betaproteobacteria bacterium]|nr:TRAP transporter large permease [Betaproteobacteria bacterium]
LLVLLIFSGIPVAYALALAGFLGIVYMLGTSPSFEVLTKRPYLTAASYTLSVVPLFVLMGYLCLYFEIGKDVYSSLDKWMGHLPGGLAMATVGGCAAFAAVTGASIACAVAIGVVAIPEMMRYKYSPALAAGVVAAGGTLGILIPPSITFVVYGVLTEQSISKLFIAGILPGIMLAVMMMAYIFVHARFRPDIAPAGVGPTVSLREKMLSLRHTVPVLVLFLLVIGGLYAGVFSPTEGGGIGATSALIIGLMMGRFTWKKLAGAVLKTIETTSMIMFLFIGAEFLSVFFAQSRLPFMMSEWAAALSVPPFVVITFFLLILLVLGCIMPTLPVVVLLTPIIFPTVTALGFDPIWFGVLVVIMVEIGLITPPVGANVYAIAGVAKDVPMETIFKGIMPFVAVMAIGIVILMIFPQIALFLPGLMK